MRCAERAKKWTRSAPRGGGAGAVEARRGREVTTRGRAALEQASRTPRLIYELAKSTDCNRQRGEEKADRTRIANADRPTLNVKRLSCNGLISRALSRAKKRGGGTRQRDSRVREENACCSGADRTCKCHLLMNFPRTDAERAKAGRTSSWRVDLSIARTSIDLWL